MERIRNLLLLIEENSVLEGDELILKKGIFESKIESDRYMELLYDRGFFKCTAYKLIDGGTSWLNVRLTMDGYDYIDSIRSEEVWRHTKNVMTSIGSWTIEISKQIAIAYIKQKAGL